MQHAIPRLRHLTQELRAMTLRDALHELVHAYRHHYLRSFASGIAFQVLFAIIPLTLFGLGLLGMLGLEEQWTSEWARTARDQLSPPAFEVVDDAVTRALDERQLFWTTLGAALAVWQVSATTRTIMDVFDRIYECPRRRSTVQRLRVSLLLGGAVAGLLLLAAGCVVLGDEALRSIGIDSGPILWLRWPLALTMLFGVVALLVAYAPSERQPAHWVGFGSVVVVSAWALTSLLLAAYVTTIADYDSVYGALATIVIFLGYLYIASLAVLIGAQLDALVRERVEDDE